MTRAVPGLYGLTNTRGESLMIAAPNTTPATQSRSSFREIARFLDPNRGSYCHRRVPGVSRRNPGRDGRSQVGHPPTESRRVAGVKSSCPGLPPGKPTPPIFDGYSGWETWIEGLVATGLMKDYTPVWWDVRPHPRFGTLEIRRPDQPTGLDRTAGFVALLRDLCAWALEHPAPAPADRGIYQQNRWAAARYGPDAELIHDGRLVRVRDLYEELPVETSLDPELSEGALQHDQGDAGAACADIVRRTWPS